MLVFEMLKTPEEPDKWKAVEDKVGIKTVTEEEIREMLAKAGFEDDFVKFYNQHIGTACDGSGVGLKIADEFGELTFCNGIVKNREWCDFLHHRHPCTCNLQKRIIF